ncbi:MAG TPA: hypothetical protein DDZ38_02440, partial [Gammaproteobacteria bacterium]|nr:hypothetical protein [Gammaproteobacteria bacterium]
DQQEPPLNALSLVGALKVMVPLTGLIDLDMERERIQKEIDKAEQERLRLTKKLDNDAFVAKAPEAVVAKERAKAEDILNTLDKLSEQLQSLNKT